MEVVPRELHQFQGVVLFAQQGLVHLLSRYLRAAVDGDDEEEEEEEDDDDDDGGGGGGKDADFVRPRTISDDEASICAPTARHAPWRRVWCAAAPCQTLASWAA